ncbi:effector-associated constant component EACC1 [Streptomyces guryensis]|uniref:Uncharacterized protein n=1 Tax=Streptomyces guryensis TaxID=2886947 RepID=A0A9Q3W0N1_9ACTN|nr:hypothetical protein [Streptomyces guryensis]MCD9881108.1 hypothetical protein [Streptomyces guryensis]
MALLLEISALGADSEYELRSLHRWIGADETLTGACTGTPRAFGPPRPDHMGLGFDILELAVNSGLAAGALAVSIASWLDARRGTARLRMTRGRVVVEVPADTPEATLTVIRALLHDGNDENHGTDEEQDTRAADGGTGRE